MLDSEKELEKIGQDLLTSATNSQCRLPVLIQGEQSWCINSLNHLVSCFKGRSVACINTQVVIHYQDLSNAKAAHVVGKEFDAVIVNLHTSYDINLFAAVSGTIRGGGLFILLTPEINSDASNESMFFTRLLQKFQLHPQTTTVKQSAPLAEDFLTFETNKPIPVNYEEQQGAVDAIINVVRGHRRRPLVLLADRGRGKSAALGIAAANLLDSGLNRILITAPAFSGTKVCFKHIASTLSLIRENDSHSISHKNGKAEFIAPDELLRNELKTDLLIVDEAAAIPTPLLQKILVKYSRVVFASTIHGYEGSGQGFAIRFFKTLDQQTKGWKKLQLKQPIRWAANDPLEALINQIFLFDSEPSVIDDLFSTDQLTITLADKQFFSSNEAALASTYGLLVSAHYKTKPSDLLQLLDDDTIKVFIVRYQNNVVATALVAEEGEFSDSLAEDIYKGIRRPKGHLLAQSLAMHLGVIESAKSKCWRIVRIAVASTVQRQGIGKKLLTEIKSQARRHSVDVLGCSFGATPELIQFWQRNRYLPVRVGLKKEASSGAHSVLLIQALSQRGKSINEKCIVHFQNSFRLLLRSELQHLDASIVLPLHRSYSYELPTIDINDWLSAATFTHANRSFEDNIHVLSKLAHFILHNDQIEKLLSQEQINLLVKKLLQYQSWETIAKNLQLNGRKQCLALLKQTFRTIIESYADGEVKKRIALLHANNHAT